MHFRMHNVLDVERIEALQILAQTFHGVRRLHFSTSVEQFLGFPSLGVLSRGACCLLVSTCFHIVFKCFLTYNIYIGAKFVQPSGRTGTKEVIYGVPQRRWCKTCRTRQHDAVRNKKLRRAARLACPHCWQVTPGSVL